MNIDILKNKFYIFNYFFFIPKIYVCYVLTYMISPTDSRLGMATGGFGTGHPYPIPVPKYLVISQTRPKPGAGRDGAFPSPARSDPGMCWRGGAGRGGAGRGCAVLGWAGLCWAMLGWGFHLLLI